MEVSARIVRVFPQGKTLKAVASVTIEGCFVVHGVKIIETEKGVFIAMPSEKRGENYRDICHPIDSYTRRIMTDAVLSAYAEVVPDDGSSSEEAYAKETIYEDEQYDEYED